MRPRERQPRHIGSPILMFSRQDSLKPQPASGRLGASASTWRGSTFLTGATVAAVRGAGRSSGGTGCSKPEM